jgi:hypothetical protein
LVPTTAKEKQFFKSSKFWEEWSSVKLMINTLRAGRENVTNANKIIKFRKKLLKINQCIFPMVYLYQKLHSHNNAKPED